MYSQIQKERVLKIAFDSVLLYFSQQEYKIDKMWLCDQIFAEKRASFVTITMEGNLRGCIGSILPGRPLWKDVSENAISAAFHDPRFCPLQKDEMSNIELEVSVLTVPVRKKCSTFLELKQNIIPFEDGVIIQAGSSSSTFLPQVWQDIPDFNQFFKHLCLKAGLPGNFYLTNCSDLLISTYQAEIINKYNN